MASGGVDDLDALSDEIFDLLCSVCRKKAQRTEATKFCVDCQDYYCSKCVKFHDNVPALSSHKFINKDQFHSGTSSKLTVIPTERCDRHGHKHVDMYCENHDNIGCSTCMVVEHRLCKDIFFIPDYIKMNVDLPNNKDVDQELDTCTDDLENEYGKINLAKKKLLTDKVKCLKKLKEYRADLNARLDSMEEKSTADIDNKYKQQIDQLEEQMKAIMEAKVNVSAAKDDLKYAGNNESQLFVSNKKAIIVAGKARECMDDIRHEIDDGENEYVPDSEFTSLVNEMNQLGQLRSTLESTFDQRFSTTAAVSNREQSSRTVNKNTSLKIHGKKTYYIKILPDINTCTLSNIFALDDTTLILTDFNNKRLKRMNCSNYIVTDYCDIPDLYQSCMISEEEVAVSCGDKQHVQFVSVREKLVPTRKIKTRHACKSVCYSSGQLYISNGIALYIYSLSGDLLQDNSRNMCPSRISSLAVSQDGSVIYLTDWYLGVFAIDCYGEIISSFRGGELENANDVCIINDDSILVCGYSSQNVLQLTHKCEKIEEILKSAGKVQAFCLNKQQSAAIFGCNRKDSIDVYKIGRKPLHK